MPEESVATPPAVATPPSEASLLTQAQPQQQQSGEFVPWKGFASEKGDFAQDWTNHLPEELGDSRAGLAKFKTVADIAKSNIELEKALSSKAGSVKLPTEKSSPEEISAYRKAIGVPETLEKYDFKPDNIPDTIPWTPEVWAPYAEIGHKHNIPPAVMKELAQAQVSHQDNIQKLVWQEHEAKIEKLGAELRTEWPGEEYQRNIDKVKAVAVMGGLEPANPVFSNPEVVKAFAKIAGKFSDDTFTNAGVNLSKSSAEIAKEIQSDKESPLYKKYQEGDAETIALLRHHLAQANPG